MPYPVLLSSGFLLMKKQFLQLLVIDFTTSNQLFQPIDGTVLWSEPRLGTPYFSGYTCLFSLQNTFFFVNTSLTNTPSSSKINKCTPFLKLQSECWVDNLETLFVEIEDI